MKRNYVIPFFIPFAACPNKCVFCDQRGITGYQSVIPNSAEIRQRIEKYLTTIPVSGADVQIGFFGGTFTGLPYDTQKQCLEACGESISRGRVSGIRVSTRPDFIDNEKLEFLKKHNVKCIEIGAQSSSDSILAASERGHKHQDTVRASKMIITGGFVLGYQMMVGLPQSSFADEMQTAESAFELGASCVRIYPVIVVKNTKLAEMWETGKYIPLSEDEAVERCAKLIKFFREKKIKVIRCGLHPSEGLVDGSEYLAGPFHSSFGQKAESRIFGILLEESLRVGNIKEIFFNPEDEPYVFGFNSCNRHLLKNVKKNRDPMIPEGTLRVIRQEIK